MYNVTHSSVRHDSFECLSLLVARAIFVLGKSFSPTKFSFAQKISARALQKGLEVYRSTSLPPCRKTWKTLHDVGQHNLKGCGTGRQNRKNGPKLGKIVSKEVHAFCSTSVSCENRPTNLQRHHMDIHVTLSRVHTQVHKHFTHTHICVSVCTHVRICLRLCVGCLRKSLCSYFSAFVCVHLGSKKFLIFSASVGGLSYCVCLFEAPAA